MDKIESMQKEIDNVSKEMKILRKQINAIDKKHCNRNEE